MSPWARRRWSPRSNRPPAPKCTNSSASPSTRTASISSTTTPRPRSSNLSRRRPAVGRPAHGILGEETMTQIDRRRLLQLSGAGAATAATGGLAGILASGRAPAYAQALAVHWLRWADFVPASDQVLKGKIVEQCQKDIG